MRKLERKFGKYAIPNLMMYVIALYAVGAVFSIVAPGFLSYLELDFGAVLHGQIWRLVTFIISPPDTSLLFLLIVLYMYYMIGSSLEQRWGTFAFNFYFVMGIVFHIVAAAVVYFLFHTSFSAGTYFLNMSLFFAFVTEFPDTQFLLFFIIPIKGKWLGYINAIYFAVTIVGGLVGIFIPSVAYRLAVWGIYAAPDYAMAALVSMLNYFVFYYIYRQAYRPTAAQRKMQKQFRAQTVELKKKAQANAGMPRHRCAVCGRTELDDPNLEFRYCSKCEGSYEYCQDHLYTHQHVTKH